jgi:hypothetical protein
VDSVSTLAALLLDVYVFKRATARGKYNQMEDFDNKQTMPGHNQPERSYNDVPSYNASGSAINLAPQRPLQLTKAPRPTGYAVPEEQFSYDTGYNGGHMAERR